VVAEIFLPFNLVDRVDKLGKKYVDPKNIDPQKASNLGKMPPVVAELSQI
jgi:hypothetical protein